MLAGWDLYDGAFSCAQVLVSGYDYYTASHERGSLSAVDDLDRDLSTVVCQILSTFCPRGRRPSRLDATIYMEAKRLFSGRVAKDHY